MRDLHKTLKLFSNEFDMDYCEDFDEIKSFLVHCNNTLKPFNKVHFRGGNEPFISELASHLRHMLLSKSYLDGRTMEPLESAYAKLRKITLFLFANTDTTYKYNLRDDLAIRHLVEVCPLLPKFLLVALVWELKLDKFFYEALAYTPCWFAFQYFEPASDSMKYINDPYQVLEKVEQLVTAIFLSISRSDLRQMEIVEKKIIYNKLYDYTMIFLRQFYTPDVEKFQKFTKLQLHKYFGYALKHLLDMLLRFFDIYEQPEKVTSLPSPNMAVYDICQHLCKHVPEQTQLSALAMEQQLKVINVVLNTLQSNVKQVKIHVFMHWVEVDFGANQNLQLAIGELAHKVCERILANRCFEHDVVQQLSAIAIRPKTLQETICEATLGEILRSLDDDLPLYIKRQWFDEVISRTTALGNEECLNSIKENIGLMTVNNCQQILNYIHLEIKRHQEEMKEYKSSIIKIEQIPSEELQDEIVEMDIDGKDFEYLISIVLNSLVNFSPQELLQLISFEIQTFGEDTTICCTSEVDFHQRATKFLNKCSSTDFDLKGFLLLCFENPQVMWTIFFEDACHNSEHITTFCITVRDTRPFSSAYFSTLLTTGLHDLTHLQQKYFPTLLCEIYFILYYPERKTEFLKQFINKSVVEMLDSENFAALLPITKALNLISVRGQTQSYKPLIFDGLTAPVLLMMAQIMEKARWDLVTYSNERDEILCECIQFIQSVSKKFLPVATEKDRKWISKVMKDSYHPITQYYFQKFSQSSEQSALDFDRFLIRLEIENKSEAEMFLIINYVRCTLKEAEWLARSERLLPHISDMMLILGGVVMETTSTNAINNYRHCMITYAHIVIKFLLPKIENNKEIEKLALKVLKIIESSPAEIYGEMFMSFEWLLLEILKKCSQPLETDRIQKCVIAMPECKTKSVFLEKFQMYHRKDLNKECF